jgi:hypothetical protein
MAETLTQPAITKRKACLISAEEAEKLSKYMDKPYILKGNDNLAKRHFFKVIGFHPYENFGQPSTGDKKSYNVVLQKYYRNKIEKATIATEGGGTSLFWLMARHRFPLMLMNSEKNTNRIPCQVNRGQIQISKPAIKCWVFLLS